MSRSFGNAIKPDPEGILRGCKDLGIHPADCIYVGDHKKDLEAGINAGTAGYCLLFWIFDSTW